LTLSRCSWVRGLFLMLSDASSSRCLPQTTQAVLSALEGRAIRARAIALAGSSGYALPSSSGSWEGSAWVRDLAPMLAEKQELISRCISALPASVSSVSKPPATLLTPLPLLSLSSHLKPSAPTPGFATVASESNALVPSTACSSCSSLHSSGEWHHALWSIATRETCSVVHRKLPMTIVPMQSYHDNVDHSPSNAA
jgi:hypothetical protein